MGVLWEKQDENIPGSSSCLAVSTMIKLTRDVIVLLIEDGPGDEDLNGHRNLLKEKD